VGVGAAELQERAELGPLPAAQPAARREGEAGVAEDRPCPASVRCRARWARGAPGGDPRAVGAAWDRAGRLCQGRVCREDFGGEWGLGPRRTIERRDALALETGGSWAGGAGPFGRGRAGV